MKYFETPVVFDAAGAPAVGICAIPRESGDATDSKASIGVLILVGGPQYRAGSHRQFVLLSRDLASRGFPAMRFDFSGTGDSTGTDRSFEFRDDEIHSAIDVFAAQVPGLRQVVLWGLCDGASAALLYAPKDPRVAGLVLLNPWVRSEEGLAKAHLKHYYGARLRDPEFWSKLASGRMNFGAAIGGWLGALKRSVAARPSHEGAGPNFQARMADGWRRFSGAILLIVSGMDLTAKEFLDRAASDPGWNGLLAGTRVSRRDFPEADHTFSCERWRNQVAAWTAQWVDSLGAARR